ncbi:MAG: hydantoinase/oxoprolinase family protein, partial [Thermaerobacterales bacterium]
MSLRIGIDIGGTFTDLVGFDPAGGQMYEHKVLTTPDEPAAGILKGIREMLAEAGLSPDILHDADILHGTTLVTNALIEQKGRPTALLTTRGAGDVLETGKENRYDPYDRLLKRPEPLVPRWRRHQINERLLADGSVRTELDRAQVARTLEALADEGVEAVAVCFLHSYADAGHEQAVREIAESLGLRLYISLSSDIAPEIGEWERVMTTTANAYIQPIVEGYLGQLRQALTEAGHRGRFYLMWSDGGLASAGATQAAPIRLLESGPAAGALAAGHFARSMDLPRVIAFDMGGTTAKICLITDGDPVRAPSFEVGRVHRDKRGSGLPVRVPSIQMLEIGAGGGSLAAADDLGFLKVGPQSAGAEPGPACYGLGGTEATVTDANLLLGYLPTESRLAGGLRLDSAKAETAVAEVAHRIGLSTQEAAVGVRRIVTSNMAQATQLHVTERGEDPRDYVLMAFGGASPLHAYDVARSLGIGRVVVPRGAGVLCSFGFLTARVGLETIQTLITPVRAVNTQLVQDTFAQLSRKAIDVLASAGVPADQSVLTYSLDMRYAGQGFEIQVAVPGPDGLDESRVTEAFNRTYFERYGVDHEGEPEIRACRIRAEGPDPAVPISTPVQ